MSKLHPPPRSGPHPPLAPPPYTPPSSPHCPINCTVVVSVVVVVGFSLVGDLTHCLLMLMQCCRLQKCALVDAAVSHVASCLAVLVRLSLPACVFFPLPPACSCIFLHFLCLFVVFFSFLLTPVDFQFIHYLFQ